MNEQIKRLHFNVKKAQNRHPNSNVCLKCGLSFSECTERHVKMSESVGAAAVCQYCWDTSDLITIIACYNDLYQKRKFEDIYTQFTVEHLIGCVVNEFITEENTNERKKVQYWR